MSKQQEAMQLALEALIAEYHMENSSFAKRVDCIFKEALAEQPAQRTWVGLTDDDMFELAKAQHGWEALLLAAEAKLRSKNENSD